MQSSTEHDDAARIATAAGKALLAFRSRSMATNVDSATLRDTGDRISHDLIVQLIHESYPQDPILSEEAKDDRARLGSSRVWIVDPLDGTREYGEDGRGDWAVHIALVVDGNPVAGSVALPARDLTLSTPSPPVPNPRADRPLSMVVSRTRPPAIAQDVATRLSAELIPLGSAGAKAMAIVLGEADIYLHAGGQYEWDSAAPVAVALAAGLHVSRLDGTPLKYNQTNPWLPDLLICRHEHFPDIRDAISDSI